jgi:hypothetical protein
MWLITVRHKMIIIATQKHQCMKIIVSVFVGYDSRREEFFRIQHRVPKNVHIQILYTWARAGAGKITGLSPLLDLKG